jgi:hypothetical protein
MTTCPTKVQPKVLYHKASIRNKWPFSKLNYLNVIVDIYKSQLMRNIFSQNMQQGEVNVLPKAKKVWLCKLPDNL